MTRPLDHDLASNVGLQKKVEDEGQGCITLSRLYSYLQILHCNIIFVSFLQFSIWASQTNNPADRPMDKQILSYW